MHAYQDHQKLSSDYHRIRKPVYQLYELMNHVQLFGSEYVKPLCETLDRVMG
jgi:fructosamine-3-kinase